MLLRLIMHAVPVVLRFLFTIIVLVLFMLFLALIFFIQPV
jgi:hypothetical protein